MPQFQIQTFLIQTIYLIIGLFLFFFLTTKFIITSLHKTLKSREFLLATHENVHLGRIVDTIINSHVLVAIAKVSTRTSCNNPQ